MNGIKKTGLELKDIEIRKRRKRLKKMVHTKALNLKLEGYGSYLGRGEGCLEVKQKDGTKETYPLFEKEIGEAILKEGGYVSVSALKSLALWNIDTIVTDWKNMPVAVLMNLDDFSHVKTRVSQYEAVSNHKGIEIARQFVSSKIEGQNRVLEKYGFMPYRPELTVKSNDLKTARRNFTGIEGRLAEYYYSNIFQLFPEKIRPESRKTYKAYDGLNNLFNFGYQVLRWKIQIALIKAKLEPYLGFLHSTQFGKPSLVCDFQELYRYLIDDFLIDRCKNLHKKDFVLKDEFYMHTKAGKRVFLRDIETGELFEALNMYFETKVDVPRIRIGRSQSIDSLICEETSQFAKYLRDESKTWVPRLPVLTSL
jgi:CRISPR-associated protein Cas1